MTKEYNDRDYSSHNKLFLITSKKQRELEIENKKLNEIREKNKIEREKQLEKKD